VPEIVTEVVTGPLDEAWAQMTFPKYRGLVARLGSPGTDEQGNAIVAHAARLGDQPVGLVMSQVTKAGPESAELLSVYVTPARVFDRRGFSPPAHRKVVARFAPEEPSRAPWYQKAKLPPDSEVFPWVDLTSEEDAALRRSQAEHRWIPPDLEPWRAEQPIDEVSSVGLRTKGEVVGWTINHRVTPDLVRFSIAYMRPDLGRRGASFPLWVAALERLQGTGVTCTCWEWGTLQDGLGGRPRRIATFSDGRLRGCLQMLVFEGVSRRFAYVPRGPVVDPDDREHVERLLAAAVRVSADSGATLLRLEPQWASDEAPGRRLAQLGFSQARQFIMPPRTVLVDLHPSPEDIWKALRSNTRNRIRLARKRGVEVRVGGKDDVAPFVGLFHETAERHGRPRVPAETFSLAYEHFGVRDAMRFYLASHEGTDLAGLIVFLWGRTATYLWGASSASEMARQLNPNQFLHWTAMEWARERGCTTYDLFGVPDRDAEVLEAEYSRQTGGMWNLYRFKRGFGGRVHRHLGTFDRAIRRAS
jgi:hypothetical protein